MHYQLEQLGDELSDKVAKIQIMLNGTAYGILSDSTVSSLLNEQNLAAKKIAVEINEQILPKALHAEYILSEGDRVEIIHAVGGG